MTAGHRERLERVCRYALRPPVAGDRVRVTDDGQVVLQLRHQWIDGTTHSAAGRRGGRRWCGARRQGMVALRG